MTIQHVGDGKYRSHTHNDGGEVETREHPSREDMAATMDEALPPDAGGQGTDIRNGNVDFSQELGGIGGNKADSGY